MNAINNGKLYDLHRSLLAGGRIRGFQFLHEEQFAIRITNLKL
jgi:hypothetical protein